MPTTTTDRVALYERDGFVLTEPIVPPELIERVLPRVYAVMNGDYETGVACSPAWKPGDDPTVIRKIDNAHISDRTLHELCTHPAIAEAAAALTGANMVQLWAVQMLFKPPGGKTGGNIGWHQDWQYWSDWWVDGSEIFTCWVALSDVRIESGPMAFARGSNHWGFRNQGDFFAKDQDLLREQITVPDGQTWDEVPAVLSPGAVSFHHKHTYHGSGPNLSGEPRISFALHFRTEKSQANPGYFYTDSLGDPNFAPVVYGG